MGHFISNVLYGGLGGLCSFDESHDLIDGCAVSKFVDADQDASSRQKSAAENLRVNLFDNRL